ncbi:thioredoxin domain-containing protein [Saccharopolyspora erythraea]|uniref:DsbA family protein n=1 Tax=Saccharopolyspora erythraea TaxID=1836 RepID=UPI001BA47AAB|nr:thioredoxin domain-containing protein [Saccharopolyspora erythraea]QUH00736.1 thioredoxin domain-containing protein [Saccharopolyspora erythraea]
MPKTTNPVTQKSGLSINLILTLIVVVMAVVVIGGVLWINRDGNGSSLSGAVPAETLNKPDSSTLSQSPDGKVTVTEFLDYQCPACEQYYRGITKQVEQEYAGRINFVVRNFPLDMHPLARQAASAAEAAGMQGKFKEMYHALYDNYQAWAIAPDGQNVSSDSQKAAVLIDQYAQQIGLDVNRLHQDMASPQIKAKLDRDLADGEAARVNSTPTLFINGKQFQAPSGDGVTYQQVADKFRAEIDQALAR